MKHLLLLASIFLLSGCSYFIQIATFESDNVKLQEDDRFLYNDDIVTIEYKINSEGPIFDFRITNNTDQDITIDLSKSTLSTIKMCMTTLAKAQLSQHTAIISQLNHIATDIIMQSLDTTNPILYR